MRPLSRLDRRPVSPPASAVPHQSLPHCNFAFQPIVDVRTHATPGYEALVRGPGDTSAAAVLQSVAPADLARFDEQCRVHAMETASELKLTGDLHLNLLPQGFHADRDCLASTLDTAIRLGFSPERLVIEVPEIEVLGNQRRFTELMDVYRGLGMRLAIDNFGSAYAGLLLLVDLQPDQLKLDRLLCRDIASSPQRQALVSGIVQVCRDLGVATVAEGIETREDLQWFLAKGVTLMQGFYFGQPGLESLPGVDPALLQ